MSLYYLIRCTIQYFVMHQILVLFNDCCRLFQLSRHHDDQSVSNSVRDPVHHVHTPRQRRENSAHRSIIKVGTRSVSSTLLDLVDSTLIAGFKFLLHLFIRAFKSYSCVSQTSGNRSGLRGSHSAGGDFVGRFLSIREARGVRAAPALYSLVTVRILH